jgi:hypothetical protein
MRKSSNIIFKIKQMHRKGREALLKIKILSYCKHCTLVKPIFLRNAGSIEILGTVGYELNSWT